MPETPQPADPTLFDLPADPADAALDDLAAESDVVEPGEADEGDDYTGDEPAFSGVCRGGPYDGRTVSSRFPGGFLLYDKPTLRMWTYSVDPSRPGVFVFMGGGQSTQATDLESLRPAAEDIRYDVLAYDDGPPVT